jgi:hypothetical protein
MPPCPCVNVVWIGFLFQMHQCIHIVFALQCHCEIVLMSFSFPLCQCSLNFVLYQMYRCRVFCITVSLWDCVYVIFIFCTIISFSANSWVRCLRMMFKRDKKVINNLFGASLQYIFNFQRNQAESPLSQVALSGICKILFQDFFLGCRSTVFLGYRVW